MKCGGSRICRKGGLYDIVGPGGCTPSRAKRGSFQQLLRTYVTNGYQLWPAIFPSFSCIPSSCAPERHDHEYEPCLQLLAVDLTHCKGPVAQFQLYSSRLVYNFLPALCHCLNLSIKPSCRRVHYCIIPVVLMHVVPSLTASWQTLAAALLVPFETQCLTIPATVHGPHGNSYQCIAIEGGTNFNFRMHAAGGILVKTCS